MIYLQQNSAKSLTLLISFYLMRNVSVLGKAEASAYLQVNSGTRGITSSKGKEQERKLNQNEFNRRSLL